MPDLRLEQILRERKQRDAALGRRSKAASEGLLGPVIARWINVSVAPIAERLRIAARAYLEKDYFKFAAVLDSPVFGLAEASGNDNGQNTLWPILQWCLKGKSPGREAGGDSTYADDMVLAALGTIISLIASRSLRRSIRDRELPGLPLATALSDGGEAARETGIGQFITQVQGAEAMLAVRQPDRASWAQTDRMSSIAAMMQGQVRSQLESHERGEIDLAAVGGRTVLKVITNGNERRISLRAPDATDWQFLEGTLRSGKGEQDTNKSAWVNFALIVLCCAQAEHGWFDLIMFREKQHKGTRKWKKRYLVFAEEPLTHLKQDLDKWLHLGFIREPMLVCPEQGDYLTVKHKPVAGGVGPMGNRTSVTGADGETPCTAWKVACDVMASTPWQVSKETLQAVKDSGELWDLALKSTSGDEALLLRILGEYSRDAGSEEIFLPIYMDFRGRLYPQSTWVTYQGSDLQKGLLRFPPNGREVDQYCDALCMHLAGVYGHDKWSLKDHREWLKEGSHKIADAEDPIQYLAGMQNWAKWGPEMASPYLDSIPCQIDGTCNGLQHLSALFRDETAAPWVNLEPCTFDDPKADIYGKVADGVTSSFDVWDAPIHTVPCWMDRVGKSCVIDRKVCKTPVMVLPYGGTLNAIEDAVAAAILAQHPDPTPWLNAPNDPEWVAGNYAAFKDRALKDHPMFRSDMKKLAKLVYDNIKKVIPRAMDAMDAFRDIAGRVGERSLEWSTGFGDVPLWIVHAYPKSARSGNSLRGLHFPNSVRGLQLLSGRDEVDPRAHRSGIVANFIHSQDASHLARTMKRFREEGGTSFGAIHDCLLGRPSEMPLLNDAVRQAFFEAYTYDPLSHPTKLRDLTTGKVESFDSWYLMAKALGVSFPDRGKWEPTSVLKSAWFFS